MNRVCRGALLALVAAGACVLHAAEPRFAEPILLTSCGQSADVLLMKILLTKDSLRFEYLPQAGDSDLAGKGSLLLVLGGSSKGLGAAKTSAEVETSRISKLLAAAKETGIPVLAAHLGGQNRRGPLSDPFCRLGAEDAARIIVVKGGNEDGFFTRIAEEKSIPLDTAATALEAGVLVARIYRPPHTESKP